MANLDELIFLNNSNNIVGRCASFGYNHQKLWGRKRIEGDLMGSMMGQRAGGVWLQEHRLLSLIGRISGSASSPVDRPVIRVSLA